MVLPSLALYTKLREVKCLRNVGREGPGYPLPANRNVLRNELAYVLDYVWQVMGQREPSEEFVKRCYVNPSPHNDAIALVRELLAQRSSKDALFDEYKVDGIETLPTQLAHLPSERPFVILGEVGRGKTSFLRYLRYVGAKDLLTHYIQLDVDFLDRPDGSSDVRSYIHEQIEAQLLQDAGIDIHEDGFVRGVLHGELMRLKKSPQGKAYETDPVRYRDYELEEIARLTADRHRYFAKVFNHLRRGRRCSLALFMDNLDRRSLAIQEEAFLKASAVARDWACLVFVSLRPDTFYRSRERGVLDAIAPTTFTVANPELSVVLKRRFAYGKEMAEGKRPAPSDSPGGADSRITVEMPRVARILGFCEFSARKRRGIIPILEAISNGNIRRLLDYTKAILCSGHLDTAKIARIIEETGGYSLPDFEGIKSLLYGEYMHYDPRRSPFINLFDVLHADTREHFVAIAMLHFLDRIPLDGPTRGFALRSSLTSVMAGLGISRQVLEVCVQRLEDKELIKRKTPQTEDSRQEAAYRLTALGRFHLHQLAREFQYLDAMVVDTPILDSQTREALMDVQRIAQRLERTRAFLDYLDAAAKEFPDSDVRAFWDGHSRFLREEMNMIEKRTAGDDM